MASSSHNHDLLVSEANNQATNSRRYAYKAVLGEGSFGSVLKATDKSTNEDVAIKIIKIKKSFLEKIMFFKTPASLKQGIKEALMLTHLQQENIIAIRDHFKFRKSAFKSGLAIVMEYCPGGNLQKYLEGLAIRGERTTVERRLSWFKQLASALAFIHHKDVAHRDLKPENILIGRDGQLKVVDVSIAKTLYDNQQLQGSYQEYMETYYASTCPYMASEAFYECYTISSDVFSMGLVMFAIGELPYNPQLTGSDTKLMPIVQYEGHKDYLDRFLHNFHTKVNQSSTKLMNATHCPSDERELLDSMLRYDHHQRPPANKVLEVLNSMIEKQRSKHEEAERRHREEEARRRGKKGYEAKRRTNESENTDEQGGAAFQEYMRIAMIQKIPTVLRDFRVHVAFILICILILLLLIIILLLL